MKIIYLIHSFHFLNIKDCKLCFDTFNIVDNQGNKLCALLNIPKDKYLYNIKLVKLNLNPFNNLKIEVELNYDGLYNLVESKNPIPDKKELIKLLKKYKWKTYEEFNRNETIKYNSIDNIKNNGEYFIKNNLIRIDNIIIDLEKEKFHILTKKNIQSFYIKNIGIKAVFYSQPNKNIINQLKENKILNNVFLKKQNLIITDQKNKYFLNFIPDSKVIKSSTDLDNILYSNAKFITIYENFYKNNYNKINCICWNSVILLNLHNTSLSDNYRQLKSFNKIIFLNSIDCYNFIPEHISMINLLYNENICFKNIDNLKKIKDIFYLLEPKKINYQTKYFPLQTVDKNYIKTIDNETYKQFISLKENYMFYSMIDFDIFKKKSVLIEKFYNNKNNYLYPECSVCLEKIPKNLLLYTKCNHYFCETCIIPYFRINNKKNCPLCRREVPSDSLLKIRYDKNTQYMSNKLKFILSFKEKNILIISYFSKSIQKLKQIFENCNHSNNFTLAHITSLNKLETLNNTKPFNKIFFLEDYGENFNYYKYYITNFKLINAKNVKILATKLN